jgi:hypothetical protein
LKISQLIAAYLVREKKLTLQGLGHFTAEVRTSVDTEPDKNGVITPAFNFHFQPAPKVTPDEGLIRFISVETGKIMPLATSDLDSFLEIGRQLLNISKPFVIEGVGVLQKNAQNQLEFIQEETSRSVDEENPARKNGRQTQKEDHIRYSDLKPGKRKTSGMKTAAVFTLVLTGLGIIGLVGYYFYNLSKEKISGNTNDTIKTLVLSQPPADSTHVLMQVTDTVNNLPADTVTITPVKTGNVDSSFRIVLEIASKSRALRRFADLKEWGHKPLLTELDSNRFKISIAIKAPLSDSIRHRDSLCRFFGKKVWIETSQHE